MERSEMLLERLKAYGETQYYAFHMPGHKRQTGLGITSFPNPFSVDITEIDGFDNLHHPEGILKESMEYAAGVYHSDKTYYLVNGSTCGILSAISAAVRRGGRILLARNSHKSAYHAVFLNQLDPVYLYPECLEQYRIQAGINPAEVERKLREQDGIQAVFITSPTYEGIVSDVAAIAELAHKYGIPLIVDEAHGSHFSFGDGELFPASALDCGADLVVQSVHKTLPSLTQTALLHMRSSLIDAERLEQYLQIYQSSSPSYVFMSSIENCIFYMDREGRKRLREYGDRLREWGRSCQDLCQLEVLTEDVIGSCHIQNRDISKIIVSLRHAAVTGSELSDLLREQYRLEPEMCCQSYVIFMTSLMDSEEGLTRLREALFEIDGKLKAENQETDKIRAATWIREPVQMETIAQAMDAPAEHVLLAEAKGRTCGSFITVYPPGIPVLVPGELITGEAVSLMTENREAGLTVEGITADGLVRVL